MYKDMVEQISGKSKRSKSVEDPSTDNDLSSGSDKDDVRSEKKKELESNAHQLVKFFQEIDEVQEKMFEYLAYRVKEYDKFL
jgi:hypothetical protein